MAFKTVNGYDVEHASSLLVYDNLFPEIQHINGKGCNDTYTKTSDVESVTLIDVMRVLPYAPRFRKLGAMNNGSWHNQVNEGGFNNAPQSVHYTIPVDLIYDEGVAITSPQIYANPVKLKAVVMAQLVKTAGLSINIITFAKQFEAFFRDSFADSSAATAEELANAVFAANPALAADQAGSYADAFIAANSALTDGCLEIGAMQIPLEERQGFITPTFDRIMKRQYMQNASEAAARILANGFINPFTNEEGTRINSATGLAGQYDGVDLFLYNSVTNKFVEVALGLGAGKYVGGSIETGAGLSNLVVDEDKFIAKVGTRGTYEFTYATSGTTWKLGEANVTLADYGITVTGSPANGDKIKVVYALQNPVVTLFRKFRAMIVYGAGTCRGIVGPSIEANPNTYFGGVYILPKLKVGVEVLNGKTIKMVVDGGWTAEDIKALAGAIKFTPIDGKVVKGEAVFGQSGLYNDGTNN